jgi:hypothetical protein
VTAFSVPTALRYHIPGQLREHAQVLAGHVARLFDRDRGLATPRRRTPTLGSEAGCQCTPNVGYVNRPQDEVTRYGTRSRRSVGKRMDLGKPVMQVYGDLIARIAQPIRRRRAVDFLPHTAKSGGL